MRQKRVYDPNDCKKPLPTRIRSLRIENGWSQEQLGQLIGGTTKSNIANYESGMNVPPVDKIIALAQAFHVSADYLLGLSDAKTNDATEQAVCDYIGLDVETVQALHSSVDDRKQHIAVDFLFNEKNLLDSIIEYAWSSMPKLLEHTDYKVLEYSNYDSMKLEEKNKFSAVIFQMPQFHEQFADYCFEMIDTLEGIIQEYVISKVDTANIIHSLSFIDHNADIFHEIFESYESSKYEELWSFEKALSPLDQMMLKLLIQPETEVREYPRNTERLKGGDIEHYIEIASKVLREKAKRKGLLKSDKQDEADTKT